MIIIKNKICLKNCNDVYNDRYIYVYILDIYKMRFLIEFK